MDIEQFIRDLPWSDQASTHEKSLVAANLRNLYAAMVDAVRPVREALCDIEAAIDEQVFDARSMQEAEWPADHEWPVTITEAQFRAVTKALNAADFLKGAA